MTYSQVSKECSILPLPALGSKAPEERYRRLRGSRARSLIPIAALLFLWGLNCRYVRWLSRQHPEPLPGTPRNPAYLVKAYNGAVASENKICSELGVSILKQGGNAVDSVVAATFCTGVVNMFSCVDLSAELLHNANQPLVCATSALVLEVVDS